MSVKEKMSGVYVSYLYVVTVIRSYMDTFMSLSSPAGSVCMGVTGCLLFREEDRIR